MLGWLLVHKKNKFEISLITSKYITRITSKYTTIFESSPNSCKQLKTDVDNVKNVEYAM